MHRDELVAYLDGLLETARFRDYSPNGLQVEGCADIHHLVCGVTANQALLDAAVAAGADGILVHHGWFWRGEESRIVGIRRARLATALGNELNLFAYHLPLDAHPVLGNNAQWGAAMAWQVEGRFGDQSVGFLGRVADVVTARQMAAQLAGVLGRQPQLVGNPDRLVRRVAWCSGAAQDGLEEAIAAGADLYVSGEISERTVHLARESGVPYIAAGHHATERYGIRAMAAHLAEQHGIRCEFVDVDTPV